jgi:flagellar basal body-associated protein FliL
MHAPNRLARVALAMNALLLLAAGLALGRGTPAPAPPPVDAAYPTIPLEGSLVHLQRGETDTTERHASIQLDLELQDQRDRGPLVQNMSALREVVLSYFSDRTAREIRAPGSLDRIKEELLPRLNRRLAAPRIRAVYITQIVVQ